MKYYSFCSRNSLQYPHRFLCIKSNLFSKTVGSLFLLELLGELEVPLRYEWLKIGDWLKKRLAVNCNIKMKKLSLRFHLLKLEASISNTGNNAYRDQRTKEKEKHLIEEKNYRSRQTDCSGNWNKRKRNRRKKTKHFGKNLGNYSIVDVEEGCDETLEEFVVSSAIRQEKVSLFDINVSEKIWAMLSNGIYCRAAQVSMTYWKVKIELEEQRLKFQRAKAEGSGKRKTAE